ncbi:hypothetical protein ONZ45_g10419 [Pleurotus djamor]|nr:hypothetical protein ONZ45_g10419 [Pleurotus djamor]
MESISRLREALVHVLNGRVVPHGEQEIFDELIVHKSRLLNLYDVGPRNPQQQKELESGKLTLYGKTVAINGEFTRQVLFLSQQLECSERYVAELLYSVMSESPNLDAVDYLEATVNEYHQRRRHLVDTVRFLLDAAELGRDSPQAPQIYRRLEVFTQAELMGSLPSRVFKEVESLGSVMVTVDAARKNAGSNTVAPNGQGSSGSLGADLLTARFESLRYERRQLAVTLTTIARMGYFTAQEVKLAVDWLSSNPNSGVMYYIFTSVISAFGLVDPQSSGAQLRRSLAMDKSNVGYMTRKLASTSEWKDNGMKAAVLLQWTLFLTETRHRDPELENREGFTTEELESQIWNAVQGDAFSSLARIVIQLGSDRSNPPQSAFLQSSLPPQPQPDQQSQRETLPEDFKGLLLSGLENLVRSLITHASSELRKIKQRQEDLLLANRRVVSSAAPPEPKSSTRNDIAVLFAFIGLLYSSLPPERALQFWGAGSRQDSEQSYLDLVDFAQ